MKQSSKRHLDSFRYERKKSRERKKQETRRKTGKERKTEKSGTLEPAYYCWMLFSVVTWTVIIVT